MSQVNCHSIQSEVKETLSLGVPLVASQLIYALSGFIGTAMVARLGQTALAASVLVSMVWMSLSVFFFGLLNAISVLVAHQYGAKNNIAISQIMGQAYLLGIIVSILLWISLFGMPFFLHFSAQPSAVLTLAREYMHSMLWMVPALIILIVHEQFLAGIGRTKMVLRISLLVVPIEIPLIYLLVFGKWGFPNCGISGIGYGFAITYSATAIFLTWYLCKAHYFSRYQLFNRLNQLHWPQLKELMVVGWPLGFMHVIEISTFAVITFWIARFGTTILAAHQIVLQYLSFAGTLVFAMSQAVTVRVGHAVGAKDITGVRYASYVGLALSTIAIVIVALGFYFVPTFFFRLDLNIYDPANRALIRDAAQLLAIASVLLIFDNFRIIGFGALRGLKDTRFSMYTSFVSFWLIGLSASYFLGFRLNFQGSGIWWGSVIGIITGAFIVYARLHYLLNALYRSLTLKFTTNA